MALLLRGHLPAHFCLTVDISPPFLNSNLSILLTTTGNLSLSLKVAKALHTIEVLRVHYCSNAWLSQCNTAGWTACRSMASAGVRPATVATANRTDQPSPAQPTSTTQQARKDSAQPRLCDRTLGDYPKAKTAWSCCAPKPSRRRSMMPPTPHTARIVHLH